MARSQPMRAVVAGLGVMGSHHLRVLSVMPDVEVSGLVDADPQRLVDATAMRPGLPSYATLSEAISELEPDFACVAVPVGELGTVAREAIAAGVPVLVEKPGGTSAQAIRSLAHEAEKADVLLGFGFVERFNPAIATLREKLEEGAIGRVVQLHARRLSPFPLRQSMSGVALDLATHDIDVMRYLTSSEVTRVFAETAQQVHTEAEDLICATLRFGTEATGLLETNWITPTKVRQLSVTGERGMFVVDYLTQDLYL